jgi:hypothetical protein
VSAAAIVRVPRLSGKEATIPWWTCIFPTSPPRVIDHFRVRVEEFLLEDRQVRVVQVELEPQRLVGDPSAAVEPGEGLIKYGEKVSFHLAALLKGCYAR